MKAPKKFMLEDYPRTKAMEDLLLNYLWDSQTNTVKPDATERNGSLRIQLYRASSASGGYVVIKDVGYVTIKLLDDARRELTAHSPIGYAVALNRIMVAQSRILHGEKAGQR